MNHVRKFTILSNKEVTNWFPDQINLDYLRVAPAGKWQRVVNTIRLLRKINRYDAFIAFNPSSDEMFVAFVTKWMTQRRTLFVFFDMLIRRPVGPVETCKSIVKGILFSGVNKFFCVHKDTSGYQKYYKISPKKFLYVPFKANNYLDRLNYESRDGGYVLACGVSHRDYQTFIDAMGRLNLPAKIVLPQRDVAKFHHSVFDEEHLPMNVQVVRNDFDRISWYQHIANARVVVIPILRDAIQAAGISVCLEAMAIGKPVVITEGVSTRGMLTEQEAEIVAPADSRALGQAVAKLWNNPAYRERLAKGGQNYALSLGGNERLVKDILRHTCSCLEERAQKLE